MDKIPRIPSHSETHARVRCKAAEHKLSCLKDELDKVRHTESRSLGIHRNRFVIDRRRSLGNVYVTQMEGVQSHKRGRRPRRESAPEVIDIFQRQDDRRQSVKAIEKALSKDVMRRLERKYQEAMIRTGSDVEDQDDGDGSEAEDDDQGIEAGVLWAPNIDIEGPDYRVTRADDGDVQGTGTEAASFSASSSSSHQPSTSQMAKRHATANQETPKETAGHKTQTLTTNQGQGDDNTTSDSAARAVHARPSDVTKETPSSPAQTRQVPRKKRSYSDGNIFLDIMAFENRALYPYTLTKAGVGGDEENSEDEMQMPSRQRTFTVGEETSDSHSSSGTSENELSGGDSDVNCLTHRSRRRVGTVSFDVPPFDVKLLQRHQNYVKSHSPEPDVTQSPTLRRRHNDSYRHTEEIRLSPSLKRRLAHSDLASPRYAEKNLPNTCYSPSVTRRQAEVNYVSSQTTSRSLTDDDSPTRRVTKRDKPKRIYQQGDAGKQMRKSRPLRRSRSENVDISALVSDHEAQDFGGRGARTARRGSDSLQTLSPPFSRNAPRGWNSLMFGLALSQEEREDIARHKRKELVTSLRKRQQEVDSDVSRRIRTFLQRYDDA